MTQPVRRLNSHVLLTLFALILLLPLSVSAEVLAYKQLQTMYKQGSSWHLVFVERLANTGLETVNNIQITTDLSPLGTNQTVRVISAKPFIQIENSDAPAVGVAEVNSAFNGDTVQTLLLDGGSLGPDEILQVSYSVDVALANGVIELQSVASPGNDLSANGEKISGVAGDLDLDTKTLISLPQTVGNPTDSCPAGQIESSYNLVKNGDFSTVHGEKPSTNEPLNISSGPDNLLANSFYSEAPYAGDDAFAADNNFDGSYSFNPENGISIQQSNIGAGITLFGGSTFQHGFPGDSARGVAASDNYLLYNGNTSSATIGVWQQQLSGLTTGAQYHFIAYASNAEWPGNSEKSLPSLQLLASGAEGGNSTPFDIRQEKDTEPDLWSPVSTLISPVSNGVVELSIRDNTSATTLGDQLALAQIGLFKCLVPENDDDNDGLSNGEEQVLGTNPDDSDTDGDEIDDFVEVGSVSSPADEDDDGVIDALESLTADSDGDGIPDQQDPTNDGPDGDADKDGVSNGDEAIVGSDPNDQDTDGDGKFDGDEFGKDSDGDGKPDIIESSIDDEDNDGLPDEFDNFDNRPASSTDGGGGSTGLIFMLLSGLAITRKRWLQAKVAV